MGNCISPRSKNLVLPESYVNVTKLTEQSQSVFSEAKENSPSSVFQPPSAFAFQTRKLANRLTIKRSSIKDNEVFDAPTAVITDKQKTESDKMNIKKSLMNHFIFNNLPAEILNKVISNMKSYSFDAKSVVFTQNNPGNCFFIVASGKLEILLNNQLTGVITKGQSFGELALMHNTPRPVTVMTTMPSIL